MAENLPDVSGPLKYYIQNGVQSNLNSSNTDGSFTWLIRTRFLAPTKFFRQLKKQIF